MRWPGPLPGARSISRRARQAWRRSVRRPHFQSAGRVPRAACAAVEEVLFSVARVWVRNQPEAVEDAAFAAAPGSGRCAAFAPLQDTYPRYASTSLLTHPRGTVG